MVVVVRVGVRGALDFACFGGRPPEVTAFRYFSLMLSVCVVFGCVVVGVSS